MPSWRSMNRPPADTRERLRIAFGPKAPEFGSWNWIGADLCRELARDCDTLTFRDHVPECDVAVFIKFLPPAGILTELKQRARIVFCPVDIYGSAAEIDASADVLRLCDCVVIHCERLRKYFAPYVRAEYIDHHLKFVCPLPEQQKTDGPLVWIGNRANLPPVVEWVNSRVFSGELWILTDLERAPSSPAEHRFHFSNRIRVENWTEKSHIQFASLARAAFDVKGDDFRARHKPPAKALDWIASGVPLAMNVDSSSTQYIASFGFNVCGLEDTDRWLSREYWDATQRCAQVLQKEMSLRSIAHKWRNLIEQLCHRTSLDLVNR